MWNRLSACLLLSVLMLSGCTFSRSRISVMTSGDNAAIMRNPESCSHGAPLSAEGLALVDTDSDDVRTVGAEPVGLTTLGPIVRPRSLRPGEYFLGAGDSLGQAIFSAYAVVARAERARELNEIDQPAEVIVSGESIGE